MEIEMGQLLGSTIKEQIRQTNNNIKANNRTIQHLKKELLKVKDPEQREKFNKQIDMIKAIVVDQEKYIEYLMEKHMRG